MSQVSRPWSLIAEAHIRSWASPCKICGEKSGTGTDLSPGTLEYPYQYHSTGSPYSYLIYHPCYVILAVNSIVK